MRFEKNFLFFFCHLKNSLNFHIMAEQNDPVMDEVMELLEAEPINAPVAVPVNIPALREELAILVSTGRCKEAIGVNLAQEQVKRLDDKEVMKYYKRYETFIGAKTTDSLIDSALSLTIKFVGSVLKINDEDALKNELKNDFLVSKQMSHFFGRLALNYSNALAVTSAVMITTNHVDFGVSAQHVDFGVSAQQITEQSPAIIEELPSNTE